MKKNLSKKVTKQLKQVWRQVGFIVNLSQMIEYTLYNILALNEILKEFESRDSMFVFEYNELVDKANKIGKFLENKSLGCIISKVKEVNYFTVEAIGLLEDVLKKRNYVTHYLFRDDLKEKQLEKNPAIFFKELEDIISLMYSVNEELNEIFNRQKEEMNSID